MSRIRPSGLSRQVSNIFWLVGGRLTKALASFVVGIFVARYLGAERFGALNYAMGISLLFSICCSMGMDGILVRELVRKKDEKHGILGSALLIRLAGAGLGFLLTIVFLASTRADWETWVLTLICSLSYFLLAADVLRGFNEANLQGKTIVVVELIQCVLSSALRIYFIAVQGSVVGFALCWLSESAFIALGLAVAYRWKDGRFSDWKASVATCKHLLKESAPLLVSAVAIVVYQQVDKIMLKNMLGDEGNVQVGNYSVALRIMPFVLIVPGMLGKALAPSLVETDLKQPARFPDRVQLYMDLMTWVGISLALGLLLLSRPIVAMYGADYSAALPLLQIVAWKGVFVSMSLGSASWIIVKNLQKWAVLRNLAGTIVNVVLNLWWIPKWQAVGAAWATVVSFSISAFLIHSLIPAYRAVFFIQVKSLFGGCFRLCRYAVDLRKVPR